MQCSEFLLLIYFVLPLMVFFALLTKKQHSFIINSRSDSLIKLELLLLITQIRRNCRITGDNL